MSTRHTTQTMECIGSIVRTNLDHGGFLVAEFRDQYGLQHTEEAKANAQLFVAAHELLKALIEERRIRILGQQPDTHWESLRDERRAAYAATDAAIAKAGGSA